MYQLDLHTKTIPKIKPTPAYSVPEHPEVDAVGSNEHMLNFGFELLGIPGH